MNNGIKELISDQNEDPPPCENKRNCDLNEKEKINNNNNDNDKKSNNKSSLMNSNISLNNDNLINILNRKEMLDLNSKKLPVLSELPMKSKEVFTKSNKQVNNPLKKMQFFLFIIFF